MKPIATGEWFARMEVGDNVTHIWEPYVVEKTRCNIWYVKGQERDLIIDSGMGLAALGDFIGMQPGRRRLALATHTHFDHIGGHHEFSERAVHPAEADVLSFPSRYNTVIDTCVTEDTFHAFPNDEFDPERYFVEAAAPTVLLVEGDIVDLGDRRFHVLHYPGHSPGSIALFEEATGILFSGDVVYDGPLSDKLFHSDPTIYEQSLLRLRDLPVRLVHGGHHASFGWVRFQDIIRSYLERNGDKEVTE